MPHSPPVVHAAFLVYIIKIVLEEHEIQLEQKKIHGFEDIFAKKCLLRWVLLVFRSVHDTKHVISNGFRQF